MREHFEALTQRESQVMRLVVAGRLNREIAAELGTSEITVKVQRSQVMRKMQAESVIDLCEWLKNSTSAAPDSLPSVSIPYTQVYCTVLLA